MTPRQKDMLDAIRDLTVDGVSPTYEELRLHLGIASKNGVHRMILGLEAQGLIRRCAGKRRTIAIVKPTDGFPDRLRALSDEHFAVVLDVIAEEIARRAEVAA